MIVKITSTASWQGDSGSCDNGLGDSPTSTGVGETCTGVKYEFYPVTSQSGDVEIDPYTPSAIVTTGNSSGSCSVWFKVEVYEVRLTFSGVVEEDNEHFILIGQKLIATVAISKSGGEAPTLPEELQDATFAWSISGGRPFSSWSTSATTKTCPIVPGDTVFAPHTSAEHESQHLSSLTAWQSSNSTSTTCYFAEPAQVNIGVEITIPGETDGSVDESLTAEAPEVDFVMSDVGTAAFLNSSNQPTSNPLNVFFMRLWGSISSGRISGVWLIARVTTPSRYVTGGNCGRTAWTQVLRSLTGEVTDLSNVEYERDANFSSGGPRLDGTHPYDPWVAADGVANCELSDAPNLGHLNQFKWCYAEGEFDSFLMYEPPGQEPMAVPLRGYTWSWFAEGSFGFNGWTFVSKGQSIASLVPYPSHPEWNDNVACYPGITEK